ncbi:hypothetical protein JCM3263A_06640 [Thermobifida fusca]
MVADHLPDLVLAHTEGRGRFLESEPLSDERVEVAIDLCHGPNLPHLARAESSRPTVIALGVHVGPLASPVTGDLECGRKRKPAGAGAEPG